MTREEVINGLYDIKNWKCNGDAEMYKTIVEAIQALKQPEPCEDAVSRKDVQSITERSDWFESSDSFNDFLWALYALPPVTPKRKKGKWIVHYECPKCGEITKNFTEYCPFCSADMRGESERGEQE